MVKRQTQVKTAIWLIVLKFDFTVAESNRMVSALYNLIVKCLRVNPVQTLSTKLISSYALFFIRIKLYKNIASK